MKNGEISESIDNRWRICISILYYFKQIINGALLNSVIDTNLKALCYHVLRYLKLLNEIYLDGISVSTFIFVDRCLLFSTFLLVIVFSVRLRYPDLITL